MQDYSWSSYKEYLYKKNITDTDFVLDLLSENRKRAIEIFEKFNGNREDKYTSAEFEIENTITDQEAVYFIKLLLNSDNVLSILNYDKEKRDKLINEIHKIKGISIKQMCRILEINKNVIYRAIEMKNKKK